jgi:hypothetical protein
MEFEERKCVSRVTPGKGLVVLRDQVETTEPSTIRKEWLRAS